MLLHIPGLTGWMRGGDPLGAARHMSLRFASGNEKFGSQVESAVPEIMKRWA
jgi:hypothetical protein